MMKLTTAFIYSYSEGTEKERRKHIYAARNNSASATEFVYEIHMFSKAEMLGFVWDILHDDDVESHGVILTCPGASGPWSGNPIAIPVLPDRQTFINAYRSTDITCITAILEYHYETMMLSLIPPCPSSFPVTCRQISTKSKKMSFLTALTITPNKKTAPSVFFSFHGSAYLVSLEMLFWFIIKT